LAAGADGGGARLFRRGLLGRRLVGRFLFRGLLVGGFLGKAERSQAGYLGGVLQLRLLTLLQGLDVLLLDLLKAFFGLRSYDLSIVPFRS